jgi:hypothetical protein
MSSNFARSRPTAYAGTIYQSSNNPHHAHVAAFHHHQLISSTTPATARPPTDFYQPKDVCSFPRY